MFAPYSVGWRRRVSHGGGDLVQVVQPANVPRAGAWWGSRSGYCAGMPIDGEYEPSSWDWVREQVAEYEASGGDRANTLLDTGLPIIVLTTRGNKSGKVRKMALMRVEHEGEFALVASQGGMPTNPSWYHNLKAEPDALVIQDGSEPHDYVAREVTGDEKAVWWDRAVAAYPPYAEYQAATTRIIPVLVARRADA